MDVASNIFVAPNCESCSQMRVSSTDSTQDASFLKFSGNTERGTDVGAATGRYAAPPNETMHVEVNSVHNVGHKQDVFNLALKRQHRPERQPEYRCGLPHGRNEVAESVKLHCGEEPHELGRCGSVNCVETWMDV